MKPTAILTFPQTGGYLQEVPFLITVQAIDVPDGISHVDFFWHSPDWIIPNWTKLGSDWDGEDGWSLLVNPDDYNFQSGSAFYIYAYDKAGHAAGAGAWDLGEDTLAPVTSMSSLAPTQYTDCVFITSEW